jgi:hypothetical protein
MATIAQQLASDFDALIKDFRVTVTFNGSNYYGTMSETTKGRELDEGGMYTDVDAIITLKSGDFSTKPKAGDKIMLADCFECSLRYENYRVQSVEYPDGVTLRLAIIGLNQK